MWSIFLAHFTKEPNSDKIKQWKQVPQILKHQQIQKIIKRICLYASTSHLKAILDIDGNWMFGNEKETSAKITSPYPSNGCDQSLSGPKRKTALLLLPTSTFSIGISPFPKPKNFFLYFSPTLLYLFVSNRFPLKTPETNPIPFGDL